MFNVGGGEIFVILLVALIVLGPQRLPGAVRQAGQFMGELRKMSSGFQNELKHAFDDSENSTALKPKSGVMATPKPIEVEAEPVTESSGSSESTIGSEEPSDGVDRED